MNFNEKVATRQSFGEALEELGKENKNVVVLDADLSGATKTSFLNSSRLKSRIKLSSIVVVT